MNPSRREFLKAAAAAGCLAPISGISGLSYGDAPPGKPLLVTLFLRGGADGLQLVGPSADPDYVAARPPELRIADSGERAGLLLRRSLDPTAGFRLHPDAQPLAALYHEERLAVIHAVGLKDGTRSHFVAQDLIERGLDDEKRLFSTDRGWLARSSAPAMGRVTAYSATTSPVFALQGLSNTLSAPDIAGGLGAPWGNPTATLLRALALDGATPAHQATREALDTLESVERTLPRDGAGRIVPYKPGGTATYDGAGELSRSLTSVARLARMDVGLTTACVDFGGWDTHENQQGRIASLIKQLAIGLAAFSEDMASARQPMIVIVMTEFGRRVRTNKSGGTDHGHGGCWLVFGDGVNGGKMYGRWPGLATQKLDQGVDLAVTTDYRLVLAEALAACGRLANESFPTWKPEEALGLCRELA